MSEKLLEAIAAVREGDNREAQQLLVEAIDDNPDDAQAWFLLSNLVDSESKKRAYLSKVLTLDPEHVKARQQMARLQLASAPTPAAEEAVPQPVVDLPPVEAEETPLPMVVEEEETPMPVAVESEEAEPDWLDELDKVETSTAVAEPEAVAEPTAVAEQETMAAPPPAPAAEKAVVPAKPDKPVPAEKPKAPFSPQAQAARLNLVLAVLVFLTILVALGLIYLIVIN